MLGKRVGGLIVGGLIGGKPSGRESLSAGKESILLGRWSLSMTLSLGLALLQDT